MKITKQEEYGLRCVLQLAREGKGRAISVREISRREGLSTDYVTKLLVIFRRDGLLQSVRGIKGGYALKRAPEDITLNDIFRPLGGFFFPVNRCAGYPGKLSACSHTGACGIRPVWANMARQIHAMLSITTLADLLKEEPEVERLVASRASQTSAEVVEHGNA